MKMCVALLLLLPLVGCVAAKAEQYEDDCPQEDVVQPEPSPVPPKEPDAGVAVSVSVPDNAWAWLTANVSTFGVKTTKPLEIDNDGAGVSIPEGTELLLSMTQDAALLEFPGIKPMAMKRLGPVPVRTRIDALTLKPDGDGVAKTGLGKWPLRWLPGDDDVVQAQAAVEKPKRVLVTMESPVDDAGSKWCPQCIRSEREYNACKIGLPFELKVETIQAVAGQSYPRFSWTNSDGKNWQATGYNDPASLAFKVLNTLGKADGGN